MSYDNEEEMYGDKYDVIKDGLKQHSPITELTKDYTFTNMNEKERKFIRIHIRLTGQLYDVLDQSTNSKLKKHTKDQIETINKELLSILLKETHSIVVLNKSKQNPLGAVLKALGGEGETEIESEEVRRGIKDWLFSRNNK